MWKFLGGRLRLFQSLEYKNRMNKFRKLIVCINERDKVELAPPTLFSEMTMLSRAEKLASLSWDFTPCQRLHSNADRDL